MGVLAVSAKFQPRAHLATIALVAFIFSFVTARAFTTFFPSIVLVSNGIHIHHFWFGLALVALGGWLGICYDDEETSVVAAILYGAGGGLIVDEVGLLLTMNNYWTGLTYAFLVVFLAFIAVVIFFFKFRAAVQEELSEFVGSKLSLYLGVFLAAVSLAFIIQTNSLWVTLIASAFTVASAALILIFIFKNSKKQR